MAFIREAPCLGASYGLHGPVEGVGVVERDAQRILWLKHLRRTGTSSAPQGLPIATG